MFINNKYYIWYNNIISSRKTRNSDTNTYYEKHHILPKSLGGNNSQDNLVKLTAREHYVCHWLLTKCLVSPFRFKMIAAFHRMQNGKSAKYKNSKAYETNRLLFSQHMRDFQKNYVKTAEHIQNAANAKRGLAVTAAARLNIANAKKGTTLSTLHKTNISNGLCHAYVLKSPAAELIEVSNLVEFCAANDLSLKRLTRTLKSNKPVKKHALSDSPKTEGWQIIKQIRRT